MSAEQPSDASAKRERRLAKHFRWQAFFQRCAEPLFVIDRRRRLLFVNRAWETLTGMTAEQAPVLVCRQPRPVSADDAPEEILAHALTPPPEVLRGVSGRVRRLLPGRGTPPQWWEVEFLPLLQEGEQGGYLLVGRLRPLAAVERVREHPLSEKLVNLRQRRLERFGLDAWTSSLPAMRRLLAQVRLASQVTTPLLLTGEAGAGKQTLARTIHYLSSCREGACAVVDCQHLPSATVAALLFGQDRRDAGPSGREGIAAIYLREPACLPRDLQLLLCQRMARSSGADSEGAMGPRILAGCTTPRGTHATPLAEAVRSGRLLEELACALSTLVLEVPPLRERRGDLPGLIERLLERIGTGREGRVTSLSADAWAVMRAYSWPSNLRELHTVLRSACARASSEQLRAADLPADLRRDVQREQTPSRGAQAIPLAGALPLEQLLEEAERRLIQLVLQRARGQKARAARLLGIPRPRLWRRMLKLGIVDTEDAPDAATDEPQAPADEE